MYCLIFQLIQLFTISTQSQGSSSGPSCPSRKLAIRSHRCSSEPSSVHARTHCIRKSSGTWLGERVRVGTRLRVGPRGET